MSSQVFLQKPVIPILIMILLFTGCAGHLASKRPIRDMTPARLIAQLQAHQAKLNTYHGFALFSAATEMGGFRGALEIRAVNPDSLWIKAEGPFGIDVGLMCLAGRDVLMYNPFGKTAFQASLDSLELRRLLPVELENSQMALGLQGLLILNADALDSSTVMTIDGRQYELRVNENETVWIDPAGPVITQWERRDASGAVTWEWEGKSYSERGRVRLPQLVTIRRSDPRQRVTLRYNHVRTNREMKPGWSEIKIPEDVHVIEL